MLRRSLPFVVVLAALMPALSAQAVPIIVSNHSFEVPDVGPGGFTVVAPPGWAGGTDVGVHNGGEFGAPAAQQGAQVGFLGNGGSFTNLFQDIGGAGIGAGVSHYRMTVAIAHRGDAGAGNMNIGIHDITGVSPAPSITAVPRANLTNAFQNYFVDIPAASVAAGDTLRVFMDKTAGNLMVVDNVRLEAIAPSPASTQAYWRHEDTIGTRPPNSASLTQNVSGIPDDSGKGNHLSTFSAATAPLYVASVPTQLLRSGLPNISALDFNPNQDNFLTGAGNPGGAKPLVNVDLNAFTIEASFNPDNLTRFHGITGRDGNAPGTIFSPVQLKLRDDTDRFQIEIVDDTGTVRQVSSTFAPTVGQWYNLVARYDGSLLELFVQSPGSNEYVLQGSLVTGGGLRDVVGSWTVGRGFFNGGITDFSDGRIDEVRISNTALSASQFLFASVPEPASAMLGVLSLGALALRRRRAA